MSSDRLLEEFPESKDDLLGKNGSGARKGSAGEAKKSNWWYERWTAISRAGLGEMALRGITQLFSVILVTLAIWGMSSFSSYVLNNHSADEISQATRSNALLAAAGPTATPDEPEPVLPPFAPSTQNETGIPRQVLLHTTIPSRPRTDILSYTVQAGDTIFGIAEQFGLKPQTIFWGNTYTLSDNPHNLTVGQELVILPVNGTYHRWSAGEGLNGVAKGYHVTAEEIINYPGNHLDPETIGDYANPNIEPGTWLIVPGGERDLISFFGPVPVSVNANGTINNGGARTAGIQGPGYCGPMMSNMVGYGSFIWPSANHHLSGYDYAPASNHFGIDIAGRTGDTLYAVDNGVVVYSGWSNYGYGYMVVLDHGNGWQTLYAHMSYISVGCGLSLTQGTPIGAIGSTGNSSGPHLHFEMVNSSYGKVNPWNFLP